MITADEARSIVGPTVDKMQNELEDMIRNSARNRSYEILVGIYPYSSWLLESYEMNPYEQAVINKLVANGFVIANEGYGLKISWEFPVIVDGEGV